MCTGYVHPGGRVCDEDDGRMRFFFSVLQNSFCVKICTTDVCKCFAFMPYIYYMPVCASASVLICRVCAGAAYGWLHADAKLHRGVTCVCVRARSFRFIRAWHIRWMLIAYQFWSGLGSGSGTVRVAKMKCNGMRRVTWDSVNVIQNNNNKKCDAFFSFGWQTDGNDYSSEVDGDGACRRWSHEWTGAFDGCKAYAISEWSWISKIEIQPEMAWMRATAHEWQPCVR